MSSLFFLLMSLSCPVNLSYSSSQLVNTAEHWVITCNAGQEDGLITHAIYMYNNFSISLHVQHFKLCYTAHTPDQTLHMSQASAFGYQEPGKEDVNMYNVIHLHCTCMYCMPTHKHKHTPSATGCSNLVKWPPPGR